MRHQREIESRKASNEAQKTLEAAKQCQGADMESTKEAQNTLETAKRCQGADMESPRLRKKARGEQRSEVPAPPVELFPSNYVPEVGISSLTVSSHHGYNDTSMHPSDSSTSVSRSFAYSDPTQISTYQTAAVRGPLDFAHMAMDYTENGSSAAQDTAVPTTGLGFHNESMHGSLASADGRTLAAQRTWPTAKVFGSPTFMGNQCPTAHDSGIATSSSITPRPDNQFPRDRVTAMRAPSFLHNPMDGSTIFTGDQNPPEYNTSSAMEVSTTSYSGDQYPPDLVATTRASSFAWNTMDGTAMFTNDQIPS